MGLDAANEAILRIGRAVPVPSGVAEPGDLLEAAAVARFPPNLKSHP
jgi:hypothetical protein